ncbi:peptidoglycan glycosyltransferase [Hyphomicrobium denitrificans 1NES1]|uniref:Peptidoglycan glycosyltransferase n=1 Tax=Hyphomicrobium denitrificans 1NES1 TaxID=670307 RepID=N0AZ77_9HYPH|nr:penicillin-binding protein 2 [Hyphomicrobium denitrificans]AGK56429.1 peptidoglycan glycosyltransferase [Hyphomicrobium denitrificans 1NES1]
MAVDGCQGRGREGADDVRKRRTRSVTEIVVYGFLFFAFAEVTIHLLILAFGHQAAVTLAVSEPVATSFSRPDIVDRNGRLLATDLEAPSIYADPGVVLDRDELVEKLATVLPDIDQKDLLRALSDRSRRFIWVRRGVSPKIAQRVHDLGLPGLSFRYELKRAYPAGALAGHVLGSVNVDNRGLTGIEKYIDDNVGTDPVHSAVLSTRPPVRLSLDIGVQHALEDELDDAEEMYGTEGAAGLILNIKTGEVLASASLPRVDPTWPSQALDNKHLDRMTAGTYELGSVFKTLTIAMAFDEGLAKPDTMIDVRQPLEVGRFTVTDYHASNRPLSVTEVFTHSSNIGAGMLALQAGPERFEAFLRKFGLLTQLKTEEGVIAAPQLPPKWGKASTITISYGHGLAVAPLQFAAAAATVLNDGKPVHPTFLKRYGVDSADEKPLVTQVTSREMARLMRLNVIGPDGTGKEADVPGYRVGGKTGTADVPGRGGYSSKSVISSFLAAFPMDDPQYLTFVVLFDPKGTKETQGQHTAGYTAAPVTGRLITRIAGQLGVAPMDVAASQ